MMSVLQSAFLWKWTEDNPEMAHVRTVPEDLMNWVLFFIFLIHNVFFALTRWCFFFFTARSFIETSLCTLC